MSRSIVITENNISGYDSFYDMYDQDGNLIFREIRGSSFSGGITYSISPAAYQFTIGSSPIFIGTLDSAYGSASIAYSVRKLKSSSTLCLKVRRSSDNSTQDIGFDRYGNLDTSTIASFVGTWSGYVVSWYDQSGNNSTASSMGITANQPLIVNSGVLLTEGGRPCLSFTNSALQTTSGGLTDISGNWFEFSVATTEIYSGPRILTSGASVSQISIRSSNIEALVSPGQYIDTIPLGIGRSFLSYTKRTSNSIETIYRNITDGSTTTTGSPIIGSSSNVYTIGCINTSSMTQSWFGNIQEIIHFPLNASSYNFQTGLSYNLYSYYGINDIGIIPSGIYLLYDYGNTTSYSGSGTAINDISGRNQTAIAKGSVTFNSNGNLSNFQFTNDLSKYINTLDLCSGHYLSGFTWQVVVKTIDNTQRSTVMDKTGASGPLGTTLEIGTIGGAMTNGIRMLFHDGSRTIETYNNNVISNNTIYFLTIRWDYTTKTGTLFQNGTQINQGQNLTLTGLDSPWTLQFGRGYNGVLTAYCNVYLNTVYNRTLSDAEILYNYNAVRLRFGI